MSFKADYISFCEQHNYVPLFHQPYWLDCVAPGWRVEVIVGYDAVAYLPFLLEKKIGFSISRNPLLTPYSGLLFIDDYSSEKKQFLFDKTLEKLSSLSLSEIDCNPQFTSDIQAENNKSTYLLSLDKTLDEIQANFKSSLKRQLKKAEKNLIIEEDKNTKRFYDIYSDSIGRQKNANKTPRDIVKKVFDLCQEKKCGQIFTAVDRDSNAHSSILYVEDKNSAYYLLGGSRKEFLGSGAMGYLLWHCIQLAKASGKKTFDFEGSEVPGVAKFFSTFGGEAVKYPVLKGPTNTALGALMKIKNSLG